MMADRGSPKKCIANSSNNNNNKNNKKKKKKKKKKKRGGAKRKMTLEQTAAYKAVSEWVFLDQSNGCNNFTSFVDSVLDDFPKEKLVFEFHCHTTCSDGYLSPTKLVERAHQNGVLGRIRDGRFLRAKNIVSKLNKLKLPVKWENVTKIAGKGVAPGRLHVARAMLEAGHVENLKQAFSRYLYDGGPAYSTGSEPVAEETVQMIQETGGVAVLAHPWALKNPAFIIRRLTEAGLHGIEAYRRDEKLSVYCDLAEAHDLLKLGGSDYHGRGGQHESDVGSSTRPVFVVHDFLKVAQPVWCNAIGDILKSYLKDPSKSNLQKTMKFGGPKSSKSNATFCSANEWINQCLLSWLPREELENEDFETIKLELSRVSITKES